MPKPEIATSSAAGKSVPQRHRLLRRLCGIYLAAIVTLWIALASGADRWWAATLIMYAPKWVFGLPLLVLVPWGLATRLRGPLVALAVAALVLAFAISRCCVPWRVSLAGAGAPAGAPTLRVLTCN